MKSQREYQVQRIVYVCIRRRICVGLGVLEEAVLGIEEAVKNIAMTNGHLTKPWQLYKAVAIVTMSTSKRIHVKTF